MHLTLFSVDYKSISFKKYTKFEGGEFHKLWIWSTALFENVAQFHYFYEIFVIYFVLELQKKKNENLE